MAIFGEKDEPGLLDTALGSTDESVARQFDQEPGGGFADEAIAVADPTRAASEQTERDLRLAAVANPPLGTPVFLSDAADAIRNKGPEGSFQDTMDQAAGKTDESVARQFDREQGGGAADVTIKKGGQVVDETTKTVRNIGPAWLDEVALGSFALLAILVVVVAAGQLFNVEIGEEEPQNA